MNNLGATPTTANPTAVTHQNPTHRPPSPNRKKMNKPAPTPTTAKAPLSHIKSYTSHRVRTGTTAACPNKAADQPLRRRAPDPGVGAHMQGTRHATRRVVLFALVAIAAADQLDGTRPRLDHADGLKWLHPSAPTRLARPRPSGQRVCGPNRRRR